MVAPLMPLWIPSANDKALEFEAFVRANYKGVEDIVVGRRGDSSCSF
jgi:hypothetical protein